MVVSLLMLAAFNTPPVICAPPTGAKSLVSRSSLRWLLLGESGHGTEEMPRAAADLICAAAAAHRPVIVGVEFALRNQPALDAYMASDGGPAARGVLLAAPMWDPDWADGKSSQSMLALFEWLRVQHRRGSVSNVIAFDPDLIRNGADREQQMARRLQATAPSGNGLFIALTGGYHARTRLSHARTTPYPPMATLLPRAQTISIRIQGSGGRNWSCTEQGCGEHDAGQTGGSLRRLLRHATPDGGYDGEYDLGVPVTPSPPVKRKRRETHVP
jgi:hypothetical protein